MNLLQFASAMGVAMHEIQTGRERATENACRLIEKTAKAAIGTYEFGWPPLSAATIERKANGDTPLLETGAMRDSIEHTVKHGAARSDGYVGTNDEKAAWQEFGTSRGIPPRPFMGGALAAVGDKLPEFFVQEFPKALKGG